MSNSLWMLQMVWASSNRVGCAIQTCYNMVVWGAVWREATYLVCNYSPKLVMFLSFHATLARYYTQHEHRVYPSQSDNASTWLRCYACSSLWYIFKTVLFFRGNWIGEAPYRVGVPCSACPPSYGGSCSNNMCFPAINSNFMYWFKWSVCHMFKGIVHAKMKNQAIQGLDELVSSSEQIWRNSALHHLLTNGSPVANGCRQNESANSW